MRAAIVTVGLGFGDEGKGSVVQYLSEKFDADLVVRYSGGCQSRRTVETRDGRRHTFSQFGSGTLDGVPTYLGPEVAVDPRRLLDEAKAVQGVLGYSPYADLSAHPDCLVETYYHAVITRARELARRRFAHGTCGTGAGAAREDYIKHGSDVLRLEDLHGSPRRVIRKLDLLRQRTLAILGDLDLGDAWNDELVADALDSSPVQIAGQLMRTAAPIDLKTKPPVMDAGLVVFEGSGGTLLDEWYGFHPHVTWGDVTCTPAYALIDSTSGFDEIMTLGVTRAFTTRHGAGPLPSHDAALSARLVDANNPPNAWQGAMRVGWLDLVLLRYAAEVNGVDAYAVTWLDRYGREGSRACVDYRSDVLPAFMPAPTPLVPPRQPNLRRSVQCAEYLAGVEPVVEHVAEPDLFGRIGRVAVTGRGPSASDYYDTLGELELRLDQTSIAGFDAPARRPVPA